MTAPRQPCEDAWNSIRSRRDLLDHDDDDDDDDDEDDDDDDEDDDDNDNDNDDDDNDDDASDDDAFSSQRLRLVFFCWAGVENGIIRFRFAEALLRSLEAA